MKKKVLIVAGAGASVELGMPSVSTIDSLCAKWSKVDYALFKDPRKTLWGYPVDSTTYYL